MTTQATQTATVPSALVAEVHVDAVERLSPAFVRVTFGGAALRDLSTCDGFDTRFKVVFPGPTGRLPEHSEVPEEWQAAWLGMPAEERSPMRTYTIREIRSAGETVQLVADFVVHDTGTLDGADHAGREPGRGELGPACRWALAAAPGDVVHIVGPHRLSPIYGGTEFEPGELRDLLVIGDETALPAVARILADVDPGFTGHVFVEVPSSDDIVDLPRHDLIDVTWLVRGSAPQGRRLVSAVRGHLGLPPADLDAPLPELKSDLDVEVWETPRYSSAGEDLTVTPSTTRAVPAPDLADTYAWIAGESWLDKALRRALVTELGVERSRVAFMGYWRQGVAMRS
jgi:NADPH-dependent ferric siderophore reductase